MTPALVLALALATSRAPAPPDTAFLTFESGALVAANWVQRRGNRVHWRSELMGSGFRDASIDLADDGTALRCSTVVGNVGQPAGGPIVRTLGPGLILWSDQMTASVEHAVLRARMLGQRTSHLVATSLFRDTRALVDVDRIDSTDWVVTCNGKSYDVLTDDGGNLLSATLPDYGVTIERRVGFTPASYPPWPAHAAAPGAPYRADSARIPAPQGHVLTGTLTVPRGTGPFAAAVLITGLSAHNRNNGEPPWMPLRDVADALSRHGVAVLRVDDRGVAESTGDRASSTTFDEADDVRTEVAWLRRRPDVDRRRILLVGYSEGGLIAPMVAAGDSTIAGIVTMAGPGVPGPDVARYQIEAAVVRDTSIAPAAREAEIERQLADSLTIREQSYLGIDPLSYARRVRCPALVLHGATDLHVPPRSAERLAWAMRSNGNHDVTVRLFPGVSHAFLPDPMGLSSRWVALPGFMTAPEVLEAITDWTSGRVTTAKR